MSIKVPAFDTLDILDTLDIFDILDRELSPDFRGRPRPHRESLSCVDWEVERRWPEEPNSESESEDRDQRD